MSALAHFIEDEGIATTGISLVREHTAGYRPPRFLWVSFPLGRPFGVPDDATFQRRVLVSALELLERDDGPVILEDFPDDAPAIVDSADDGEGWVCPVSFPPPPDGSGALARALKAEVEELSPWYDLSLSRRGRTTVGLTGAAPAQVAAFLGAFIDGLPRPLRDDVPLAENLKLACEDLKAFYLEAATARPGNASAGALSEWFWKHTAAARLMFELRPLLAASEDADLRALASDYLIPRVQDPAHG